MIGIIYQNRQIKITYDIKKNGLEPMHCSIMMHKDMYAFDDAKRIQLGHIYTLNTIVFASLFMI